MCTNDGTDTGTGDAGPEADGGSAGVDLEALYHLDRPTDTLALQHWRLDAATFDALKASLPVCSQLITIKYGVAEGGEVVMVMAGAVSS